MGYQDEQYLTDTLVDPEQLDNPEGAWTKGEAQESRCRDAWAALLFGGQVIAIAAVAGALGVPALDKYRAGESEEVDGGTVHAPDYYGLIYGICIAGFFSLVISGLSLSVMSACPTLLIQISLLFSLFLSGLMVVLCFTIGQPILGILCTFMFALSACYTWLVWPRIPFAAANLNTGLTAVKGNAGVVAVAYVLVLVSYAYSVLFMVAVVGVYDKEGLCERATGGAAAARDGDGDGDGGAAHAPCQAQLAWGYYFLLLVSIFWSQQVFQNTIHVTIAGVVSTWWFSPAEADAVCSPAIKDSFVRATTTSFGSVCFGSLLVAIVAALRQLANNARQDSDEGCMQFLLCIVECLLQCVQDLLEYFNKFAYIYVGMYGYSYVEAGKNVMTLFQQKGWSIIIADNLIANVLTLFCLIIGLLTGGVGLVLHKLDPSWFDLGSDTENAAMGTAFGLCFLVGIVVCFTTLSVVDSAVNTVLVCFAEGPREFEENHPELSAKMRGAWREVYPAECGF